VGADHAWQGRNGKQKRKAFYGKIRKVVQEKLTAALNDINRGVYVEPSAMTLGQWLDVWLLEYKKPFLRAALAFHPRKVVSYVCGSDVCAVGPNVVGFNSTSIFRLQILFEGFYPQLSILHATGFRQGIPLL
jgi:hypothetical protein